MVCKWGKISCAVQWAVAIYPAYALTDGADSHNKKGAPGTGSYTWMGRIWEFMNHKGFNK